MLEASEAKSLPLPKTCSQLAHLNHVDHTLGANPWQFLRLGLIEQVVQVAQGLLQLEGLVGNCCEKLNQKPVTIQHGRASLTVLVAAFNILCILQ